MSEEQPSFIKPQYYTVAEAQRILRYSKATMYRLLKSGALPSRGRGRLRRIPRWAVEAEAMKQDQGDGQKT